MPSGTNLVYMYSIQVHASIIEVFKVWGDSLMETAHLIQLFINICLYNMP